MADFSKIDTRTIERKIKNGEISQEEYQEYLDSLQECAKYETLDEDALIKEANAKRGR